MRKTGIGLLVAALLCGLCGCFSMDTDWRPLYSDETSEFWSDISPVQPEDSWYDEVRYIVRILDFIREADVDDEIPPTSLVREFIGGNTFYRK